MYRMPPAKATVHTPCVVHARSCLGVSKLCFTAMICSSYHAVSRRGCIPGLAYRYSASWQWLSAGISINNYHAQHTSIMSTAWSRTTAGAVFEVTANNPQSQWLTSIKISTQEETVHMLQQPVSKSVPPEVCFRWRLFLIQGAVASVLSPSAWIHLEKVHSVERAVTVTKERQQ